MSVNRRTFLSRLVGAAASGLGMLGLSCRRQETPPGPAEPAAPPLAPAATTAEPLPAELQPLVATREWPALKKVWQEMTRHATGQVKDEEAFKKLKPPMQTALAGLKKQAAAAKVPPKVVEALQAEVEQRYYHLQRTRYSLMTCYAMVVPGWEVKSSRDRLEKQYAALARLAGQGRIQPEVADKARSLIARQIEFQVQGDREFSPPQQVKKLVQAIDRETGEVQPDFAVSERSQQVARLILELCRP
jgi:hypothetical protein